MFFPVIEQFNLWHLAPLALRLFHGYIMPLEFLNLINL